MNSKVYFKQNPKYSGRKSNCPFYVPAEGVTVREGIQRYLDLIGKLDMKDYKDLAALCAPGAD